MSDLLIIKKGDHYHKTIELTAMLDNRISLQAKGLNYYMQTRPESWKIWFSNLKKFSTNGETSIRSALDELCLYGYLIRVQLRDEKKRIIRMLYISLQKPDDYTNLELDNLLLGNLNLGFKVYSYNIYSSKKLLLSKDNIEVQEPPSISDHSPSKNESKKEPVLKNLFLLEEWRLKDTTPKNQKHPKEGSKLHKKINYKTTLLLNGKFSAVGDFDPKFLSDNKISKSALSEKYTKEDLLDGLHEMAKMFKLNNQPENKNSITKMSFDSLIYHPTAHISYLLKYMYCYVQPLEYQTVQVDEDWLDRVYDERLFSKDIENDNHQFGILKKGLFGIEQYYDWIAEKKLTHAQLKSADDLLDWYITWLTEMNSNIDSPYKIGPQNNNWYRFIKWLEEAIHGDHVSRYPTLDKRKYNG